LQPGLAPNLRVRLALRPEATADDTLIDEHAKTVDGHAAALCRVTQELGLGRVRDDVADEKAGPQGRDVKRQASVAVGEEAHGPGVDREPRIVGNSILVFPMDKQGTCVGSSLDKLD
jgi:hypothetical protein